MKPRISFCSSRSRAASLSQIFHDANRKNLEVLLSMRISKGEWIPNTICMPWWRRMIDTRILHSGGSYAGTWLVMWLTVSGCHYLSLLWLPYLYPCIGWLIEAVDSRPTTYLRRILDFTEQTRTTHGGGLTHDQPERDTRGTKRDTKERTDNRVIPNEDARELLLRQECQRTSDQITRRAPGRSREVTRKEADTRRKGNNRGNTHVPLTIWRSHSHTHLKNVVLSVWK